MKNIFFLSLLMTLFFMPKSYGQLTFDDFESYPYGNFDINWNANNWDGWNGMFSNATISPLGFGGSNKSLAIVNPSSGVERADIMALLPVLNSNLVTISFRQYVEAGYGAALGLTHDYGVASPEFSIGVFIDGSVSSFVVADDKNITFLPLFSQWVELRFELDYASDTAFFYYANQMITSWKLSNNSDGDIATVNQINGINFYTPNTFGGEAYYDNINVQQYSVSAKEVEIIKAFNVFPNPATDQININFELEKSEMVQYELIDLNGRVVDNWQEMTSTEAVETRNVSDLANGIYILKVTAGESSKMKKVVIAQ
jgi:hypothetical protein